MLAASLLNWRDETRVLPGICGRHGRRYGRTFRRSLARGDTAKVQMEFEAARPAIEKLVKDSPQDGTRRAQLGLLYAFLGRREDALREGKRAMELKPITHDVIEGAVIEVFYALICARLEMTDEAISRIERLLSTPFAVDYDDASITLSDLRTRWEWDPLRKDPRFKKSSKGLNRKRSTNDATRWIGFSDRRFAVAKDDGVTNRRGCK